MTIVIVIRESSANKLNILVCDVKNEIRNQQKKQKYS